MNELDKYIPFLLFIVTGIVQVLKQTFEIDEKFLPMVSLILGILLSIGYALSFGIFIDNIFKYVILGIFIGLSGSGLFDNIAKGLKIYEKD